MSFSSLVGCVSDFLILVSLNLIGVRIVDNWLAFKIVLSYPVSVSNFFLLQLCNDSCTKKPLPKKFNRLSRRENLVGTRLLRLESLIIGFTELISIPGAIK